MTHPIIERLTEDPSLIIETLTFLVDDPFTDIERAVIHVTSAGHKTLLIGVQPEDYADPNEEVFDID